MESRKLQRTGGSTLIVSLPKKWLERMNLKRGSPVLITEQKDGTLLIDPKLNNEKQFKQTLINEKNLERRLIGKYLLGYDVLKLNFNSNPKKHKATTKKIIQNLIGLEIMEETANSLVLHNLLGPEEVSILKSLRRMHTIVSVMHKDILSAIENNDKNLLRDVVQRDKEVNRLYFLVVRQIRTVIQNPRLQNKEGIKAVDCVDYRLVAKIIEQLGDYLEEIATNMLGSKNLSKFKALKEPLLLTNEIHKKAFKALNSKDEELASEARTLFKKLKLPEAKSKETNKILNNLLKIGSYGVDLSDIVVSE